MRQADRILMATFENAETLTRQKRVLQYVAIKTRNWLRCEFWARHSRVNEDSGILVCDGYRSPKCQSLP